MLTTIKASVAILNVYIKYYIFAKKKGGWLAPPPSSSDAYALKERHSYVGYNVFFFPAMLYKLHTP